MKSATIPWSLVLVILLWSGPAWADSGMAFLELGMMQILMF